MIDDNIKNKVIELLKSGMTYEQINKKTGVSLGSISKLNKDIDIADETSGKEIVSEIKTSKQIPKKFEDLLTFHGYNPQLYDVQTSRSGQWEVQRKGGAIITLYSSRITVKPKLDKITSDDIIDAFRDLSPLKWQKIAHIKNKSSKILSIDINDIHFGKLSWDAETGENYDLKIATNKVQNIIMQNIKFAKKIKPEYIIFPLGNDLFHSDNDKGETVKGTPQDMDTRPKKVYKKVLSVMFESIGLLSEVAPVKVLLVAGNHSSNLSYYLAESLNLAFKNNPNVDIDTSPKARKYQLYGNMLLGYSHSDGESKKELYGLMQKEVPKLWGKSKFREFHLGHFHIENTEEKNGMKFRWIPSISGADKWHYGKGYVETDKTSMTFVYDKENGLETIKYFRG